MARPTYAEAMAYAGRAIVRLSASVLSGKNSDGTDFALPISSTDTDPVAVTAAQGGRGVAAWLVGGTTFTVSAEFIRPNNATPYAAYDIIANQASGTNVIFLEFDTSRVDSSGYITKARLETDRTAEAAGYRLILFRVPETGLTTRLTNLGDNDVYQMKFANRSHRSSFIDFTTWVTGGASSDGAMSLREDVRIAYGLASGSSKIYGLLTNIAAQTPQALQTFTAFLTFESNT